MKQLMVKSLLVFLLIPIIVCGGKIQSWKNVSEILERIVPPVFPDTNYLITDFGAIGNGVFDCTESINKAIEFCSAGGGGKVVVPEGKFLTGAIHLKSNVNLHLSENAVLLFSKDLKKYLPIVYTRFEGNELMNYSPFIYAYGQKNLAITGAGTIDGNADTATWWPWKNNSMSGWKAGQPNQDEDREKLIKMSDDNVPVHERIFGEGHYIRVNFIQLYNSINIIIEGIKIVRSPMWQINPVLCTNVTIRNVRMVSHGPNNDGCNPESCKDVLIEGCYFDTGDDCIAIKSGREEDGRRINVPSENIIIRNCEMKDGHGGVAIGSEISGGCRNVFIENCKMSSPNLYRALRIKSNSCRGGIVENIFMRNITVGEVGEAVILVNFYYDEGDVGNYTPVVRNIYIENVTSEKSQHALLFKGYARSPLTNIRISNCSFNGVEKENVISYVEQLEFDNVYINNEKILNPCIN
jgi:polygalacturonase